MPTKRCCCGPGEFCNGCCFPLTEGQPVQLSFEISTPNCPELDGATGLFLPEVGSNEIGEECGNCLCYTTDPENPLPGLTGTAYEVVGESCQATPCSRSLNFYLMCDRQRVVVDDGNPATDPCCQDIKLLVGLDYSGDVIGDRPRLNNKCKDYIQSDGLIIDDVIELLPIACECCDVDSPEFLLVYDLSALAFLCTELYSGGPCDGLPSCCVPGACSFDGALLTVVGSCGTTPALWFTPPDEGPVLSVFNLLSELGI